MNGTTTRIVLLVCASLIAACGQVATPFVTERPPATSEVAALPTSIDLEPTVATEAPTRAPTATDVPPTATVEPTATDVPPTATVEPTVEATPEATEVAAGTDGVGDPVAGQALFVTGDIANGALACSTCHNVDNDAVLIGPSLQGIADRAGERVPGQDAVEYLHISIVDPNAYVVEGFVPGLMPPVYDAVFTDEQINDLVAYMLTLED